ncbi:MAG: 5'-3' exonuclease H3TH domain-containing protein, partial [Bacillota bacterium]
MKRIALIDGNSLINRAYYAMRNPMITKDGIYTHGIFGFINMMDKIIRDYGPEYMAIAFDMKAPTFRHEQYDEYKAGRRKMPPELAMEIPILKDILDAMNIRRVELEGYEADDIIGTLARMSEAEGLEPFVFTGDKDQLQLATDVTRIVYTKRGVSDFDIFDHDSFCEAYGFTPLQFIDYKGLAGDSSDNIPGIPGVGGKTATKLIQEFGSVEEIIAGVDEIKPAGLQAKVRDNAQQAMMSKRLATIMTEVPLDLSIDDCLMKEPDYDRLIEIYRKLEFNKFLSRLKVNQTGTEETASADSVPAPARTDRDSIIRVTISNADQLRDIHIGGKTSIKVFGDASHVNTPHIDCIAMINGGSYYFIRDGALDVFGEWLKEQMSSDEGPRFVGHDLKPSYYMLMCLYDLEGFTTEFDTSIAQYVLDSGRSNYDISALSNEYLHASLPEEKEVAASGA